MLLLPTAIEKRQTDVSDIWQLYVWRILISTMYDFPLWVYSELRKRRLDSLRTEEDCKSAEERLRADITKLNQDRKRNVLKLKVRSKYPLFLFNGVGFF